MNDKKIISAIMDRDEQMLAYAIQKYTRLLWKIAASVLIDAASEQDVEECIADVFIYLWQCPQKYDPDKAGLASWLSMVTRSRAIDRYRRIIKKGELSMEEIVIESLGHAQIIETNEEQELLLSCLEELGETEKELIVRRYYYEQKPAEIAVAMNLPKKQIENRLYHARQTLRKRMEAERENKGKGRKRKADENSRVG